MADNQYINLNSSNNDDDNNSCADTSEYINILNILDTEIGPFPKHLINLLKFLGYDNYLSLKDFNVKDINELELFAQNDLQQLIDTHQLENYYGVYAKFTKRFRVLPGHRKLLLSIKDYLLDRGRKYFLRKIQAATAVHPTIASTSSSSSSTFLLDAGQQQHQQPRSQSLSTDFNQTVGQKLENYADEDIDYYDAHDSNDESSPANIKRPRLITLMQPHSIDNPAPRNAPFSQIIHFKPEDHEQHIRTLVNRWFQASIPKFARGIVVNNPNDFAVIFHHKPEENKLTASIQCSICRNAIGVSSQLRKSGSFRWLISNYMRHVKRLHFAKEFQTQPMPQNVASPNVFMIDDDIMPNIKREYDENEIRQMV